MNEQHKALEQFSRQIKTAVAGYKEHGLSAGAFQHVLICGMGGSGIGGQIARSVFSNSFPVPIICNGSYLLPAFVNERTLVILSSYSGNTEETLSVYQEAKARGCKILVVSGGGKLLHSAQQEGLYANQTEPGFQPRMALGFSLTYLVMMLAELIGREVKEELLSVAEKLTDTKVYKDEAQALFESIKVRLKNKLVVLTDGFFEPVGIRFAQQIQENAKHECFQHTVPEMNHNVIESYYGQLESIFFMINSQQNERVNARFDFLTSLLEVEYNKVIQIPVEEANITSVYEIIHVLDWLSLFIADFRRVDSLNVPNIMSLKEFLDSVN